MRNYIAKRLLTMIPTLLGISIVIFLIMRMIPGDTITAMIGTQYQLTEAQAEAMRAYYGLDKSLPVQYITWLTNALRGNFGYSVRTTREPGGCALAESIRQLLLTKEDNGMCPEAEALLFAAARAQHLKEVILPAVRQGHIVLCAWPLPCRIASKKRAKRSTPPRRRPSPA